MNTRKNNHWYLLFILVFLWPRNLYAAEHVSRLKVGIGRVTLQLEKTETRLAQKLLVHDYLTSTKTIVAEDGEISNAPIYYPYGSSISTIALSETNKQYTGQKKVSDDSTVYNYNARYYNPEIGVFIQPDSVEGPTRYTYVAGNPAMANDPSGNVISYNSSLLRSDYTKNPTACISNVASCVGAHINYQTGLLSALAFLTPDSSSDWLDKEVNDEKKFISQDFDMTNQAYSATGVGVAGVFGTGNKVKQLLKSIRETIKPKQLTMAQSLEHHLIEVAQMIEDGQVDSALAKLGDESVLNRFGMRKIPTNGAIVPDASMIDEAFEAELIEYMARASRYEEGGGVYLSSTSALSGVIPHRVRRAQAMMHLEEELHHLQAMKRAEGGGSISGYDFSRLTDDLGQQDEADVAIWFLQKDMTLQARFLDQHFGIRHEAIKMFKNSK